MAQPLRAGPARVAHRVHRDRARPPRRRLRRAGRWQRPGLPAPRDVRRARPGRGPGHRLRPGLHPRRDGRLRRREDVEVEGQPRLRLGAAQRATSTRWRSGWRCCATTTAPTGSGPTTSSGGGRHARQLAPAALPGRRAPAAPVVEGVLAALADDLDAATAVRPSTPGRATLGTDGLADTSDPDAALAVHRVLDAALGSRSEPVVPVAGPRRRRARRRYGHRPRSLGPLRRRW